MISPWCVSLFAKNSPHWPCGSWQVLFQIPNYDGVTDKWLAVFTMEDVRNLKRTMVFDLFLGHGLGPVN